MLVLSECACVSVCVWCHLLLFLTTAAVRFQDFVLCEFALIAVILCF